MTQPNQNMSQDSQALCDEHCWKQKKNQARATRGKIERSLKVWKSKQRHWERHLKLEPWEPTANESYKKPEIIRNNGNYMYWRSTRYHPLNWATHRLSYLFLNKNSGVGLVTSPIKRRNWVMECWNTTTFSLPLLQLFTIYLHPLPCSPSITSSKHG